MSKKDDWTFVDVAIVFALFTTGSIGVVCVAASAAAIGYNVFQLLTL